MLTTDELLKRRAPEIARAIQGAAEGSPTEAEFRQPVEQLLDDFADEVGVPLRTHHEYTLATGRADTVYNRLVVEYKRPGHLSEAPSNRNNLTAVEQIKGYIESIEKAQRIKEGRLLGVVTDGRWMVYCRHIAGRWRVEKPVPVDADSVARLLTLLVRLQAGAAMVPSNLIEDFGSQTLTAQRATRALYTALQTCEDPLVGALFEQWQTFFGEVTGYEEGAVRLRGKAEFKSFAKGMGLRPREVDPPYLFFAVHTYFALLIKFIAWLTVSRYLGGAGAPFDELEALPSDELRAALRAMERGETFQEYGLRNLLEGDFFAWYLRAWDGQVERQVREMLKTLSRYDPATLEDEPELTRDLLKQLYQYLVPRHLRHDLGEYYTPDWLAQRVLNMVDGGRYKGDPRKRVLDPACGSGTFLVLAIKATRDYCQRHNIADADALELILSNVVGIDLNPLAVIAARTNYLLALGDLLEAREERDIEIPVYLADSIMAPSRGSDLFTQDKYQVKTTVGVFEIPQACATRERIAALADVLDECLEEDAPTETFMARAREQVGLSTAEFYAADAALTALYERLADLHRKGLDGLWARIIKNAFAPVFLERFDYVVGNPPWVNWESLPNEYRQETAPLWAAHKLFPHKGFEAILGKSKDDISVLMTYVALDKYVRDGGRLGFLITQSVFKTAGAGQGFRRFRLGDGTPLGVVLVDDMADLKPFEGASNRTAIFVLERGRPTTYPVPYSHWYKPGGGSVIPEDVTLEDVTTEKIATYREFYAEPVNQADPTSPWITGRRWALNAVKKVLGASEYQARAGVCTWLNGVYWVEIVGEQPHGLVMVSNLAASGKRKVENVQTAIEPDLLYPLLRGRDVRRWQAPPSAYVLVTHEPGMRLKAIPEDEMEARLPETYRYLRRFEDELRSRSGYRRYFKETDPFYSIFNVGDYSFAPYKVVWREQAAGLTVAVAESLETDIVVPDHKLMMVDFQDRAEAHYLCAVLNSSPARLVVLSYGVTIQMDTHVLENVRIPCYDALKSAHRQLAALSQQAHEATAAGDVTRVREIEVEIDGLAAELWKLSEQELEEIQRSLEELG
ncbi:MAG: N-6 DNA methylase [Anaerolineae bacterium]